MKRSRNGIRRRQLISASALTRSFIFLFATAGLLSSVPALAAEIQGEVLSAAGPIADSTVTV
jgi:hypothetical protein